LVVAAIATLNLEAVATFFLPLTILFLGGALWSIACLLVIAPRILPRPHWFELGLINYGMSTGTTATGFVLLRLIDPELQTDAAKEYALAAPLSAPLVGGGIVTIGLPLLVLERIPIGLSTLLVTIVVIVLYLIARRLRRNITDPHTA
jgi:ESS family glutamate:Na+ symporter